jgi:hypothetical protein
MPSITRPKTAYPAPLIPKSSMWLSFRLMKNWLVALSGAFMRAMATAPRAFRRPFRASFRMGAWVGFSSSSGVYPPPWIMKVPMTRWKTVPS